MTITRKHSELSRVHTPSPLLIQNLDAGKLDPYPHGCELGDFHMTRVGKNDYAESPSSILSAITDRLH